MSARKPPLRLHISHGWLEAAISSDPEGETGAGREIRGRADLEHAIQEASGRGDAAQADRNPD